MRQPIPTPSAEKAGTRRALSCTGLFDSGRGNWREFELAADVLAPFVARGLLDALPALLHRLVKA